MSKQKPQVAINDKLECILLVDDDPISNYLHLQLLNNPNVANRVDIVTNGEEALLYLKEICHPEILFLDINMPVMDGIEFLRKYISLEPTPTTKIVILSTSQHLTDISKIKSLGINNFLVKPLTAEKLQDLFN